jgi:DNA-binding MarR family transcriptional regulator
VSLPGSRPPPADERIRELLRRVGTWLSTTAIVERTGVTRAHVARNLEAMQADGTVLRRDDPENNRRAEWRAA